MPKRCVVFGCSNESSTKDGISAHTIPFAGDDRPEAKRRRKKWVDFIKRKRANFTPSRTSVVCSKHFVNEDFERQFVVAPEASKPAVPRLRRDEFGVYVWPTLFEQPREVSMTARESRHLVRFCWHFSRLLVF